MVHKQQHISKRQAQQSNAIYSDRDTKNDRNDRKNKTTKQKKGKRKNIY